LGKEAAREREGPDRRFVRAFAALDARRHLHPYVGKSAGPKDETAAGRLFEREPGLHDLRILFQRAGKGGIERDGVCASSEQESAHSE
jgi:hypothetical protein